MELRNFLEQMGMNAKEASLYLAALEHGPASIAALAHYAEEKRSTLYHVIDSLRSKGYLQVVPHNKRVLYDAERPQSFVTKLHARERELEKLLPKFLALKNYESPVPKVTVHDTISSVANTYEEIYSQLNAREETQFLTSVADLSRFAPKVLYEYVAHMKFKQHKVRELIYDDLHGRKYVREMGARALKNHHIRLLPKQFPIRNDLILFANKVALASFVQRPTITVIEDQSIHETVRSLFETAWASAQKV